MRQTAHRSSCERLRSCQFALTFRTIQGFSCFDCWRFQSWHLLIHSTHFQRWGLAGAVKAASQNRGGRSVAVFDNIDNWLFGQSEYVCLLILAAVMCSFTGQFFTELNIISHSSLLYSETIIFSYFLSSIAAYTSWITVAYFSLWELNEQNTPKFLVIFN